MFGGGGNWLYSVLGGLNRQPGSVGWTDLLIAPPTQRLANLSTVSASIDTAIGLAESAWTTAAPSGSCGYVAENSVLTLTCAPKPGATAGNFTGVAFASFGTPEGSCPQFTASSCNSGNSVAAVTASCLGKASCSIPATNTFFGGDPCYGTVKALAVRLTGACAEVTVQVSATVPVGAQATIAVPLFSAAATAAVVTEGSGSSPTPVWSGGAYVPGVPGVTGAAAGNAVINVFVGSGTYNFQLSS